MKPRYGPSQVLFLFAITAAGVVPCGGRKMSTPTSSVVQIIFSYWSFEISDNIFPALKGTHFYFHFLKVHTEFLSEQLTTHILTA